ncbi:C40 family peptidase [Liquorilactobacillus cacaonum]|uniref:Cell wall-associated hydrolase n=1 Tax=Liquorilactobacillus cacaonum DSM 21116 TaxID=1423729 RepID=A0A0R2CR49_9LACO|nr:C40 family peptidase [Liquorilactobacillus cacaonum]KRM92228.1 hypothetical protein FC80_GL000413 [Liquorilactobacillus cacaonum DSM 21116]
MKRTTKTLLASTVGAAGLFLASTTSANASSIVKVAKNDTVWGLSQKYGVSIKSIETLNNINENSHLIVENQSLTIPDSDSSASTESTSTTSNVSVVAGDSLWTIAQKYNTTVDSLRSLNGLSSSDTLIKAGQTLKVEGSSTDVDNSATTATAQNSTTTAATSSATSSSSVASTVTVATNHVTYTVKSGDSLYTIAQAYGITVDSLRSSNSLGSAILPGETLTINDPTKTPATTSSSAASSVTTSSSAASSVASSSSATSSVTTSSSAASSVASSSSAASSVTSSSSAASSVTRSVSVAPKVYSRVTSSSTVSSSSIISYATYLASQGIPYVYGGTSLSGFDCSGFVQYVFAHFGKSLPRTSEAQSTLGTAVPVSQAKPGDLLFWGSQGSSWHVGIYIGGTSYVAAPSSGQNVSIKSYQYFQPTFAIHMN